MLVLTRKPDQKIMIGKNVVITVVKVQGEQVSIGIDAPKSTLILREEVYHEIQKENTGGAVELNSIDVKSLAKNLKLPVDEKKEGSSEEKPPGKFRNRRKLS